MPQPTPQSNVGLETTLLSLSKYGHAYSSRYYATKINNIPMIQETALKSLKYLNFKAWNFIRINVVINYDQFIILSIILISYICVIGNYQMERFVLCTPEIIT